MDYNKFESVMENHTDEKLITVLKNRNFYQEDAMSAAVKEATKRRIILNKEDMEAKFPLTSTTVASAGSAAEVDDPTRAAIKERAQKDILYGALWCIGGTVATLADVGYIFWGAIVFGGIQCVKGIINSQ